MYPHFFATLHRYFGCTATRPKWEVGLVRKFLILTTRNRLKSLYERLRPRRPPYHGLSCLFTGTHDTAAAKALQVEYREKKESQESVNLWGGSLLEGVIGPPRTGTSGLPCWLKRLSTPRTHLTVRAIIPLSNFLPTLLSKQLSLLKVSPLKVKGINCPLNIISAGFLSKSVSKVLIKILYLEVQS